ncbi:U-scoloptoxin(16)-Ssd1a-like [Bradysia coprophila]|uniref:U-scoloptoxin(16)-Ssd1a-like n=1 Tax=Bradysia coprophila TaxID=38358 RepID=UPI00187D8E3F|nr:U-scoloptoxin(16)-Ssd1a-like [Bradysia coprophila]
MFFKLSTTFVVLLSFVSLAFSAVSVSQPSVHPDHPGKCWYSDTMKAYDVGDVFTVPECTRVTCLGGLRFEYASCGVIGTSPPCYVVKGDSSLPYPECCPDVKCD